MDSPDAFPPDAGRAGSSSIDERDVPLWKVSRCSEEVLGLLSATDSSIPELAAMSTDDPQRAIARAFADLLQQLDKPWVDDRAVWRVASRIHTVARELREGEMGRQITHGVEVFEGY